MSVEVSPGQKLSDSDKRELAKENERESREAQQMAREQMDRDVREGRKPAVTEVAETLKKRMEDAFGVDGQK